MSKIPVLGFRTHFSLGESVLSPKQIAKIAAQEGVKQIGICDTMSISCMIESIRACEAEGIDSVYGVRLRVYENLTRDKKDKSKPAKIKLFPKTEKALGEIYKMLSLATTETNFYMVSRLSWEDLKQFDLSEMIVTTGDVDGIFTEPNWETPLNHVLDLFPHENIYTEIVTLNTPLFWIANNYSVQSADKHKLKTIIHSPVFYPTGQHDAHAILTSMHKNGVVTKGYTMHIPHYSEAHIMSDLEATRALKDNRKSVQRFFGLDTLPCTIAGISSTRSFMSEISYRWKKKSVRLPEMSPDPNKTLRDMVIKGISARLTKPFNGYQPTKQQIKDVYVPRIEYELKVLQDLNFATYFLVVSDVVNWSKANKILCGPGRGSVGGSLVSFLVGITDIDPIRFDLLFERFINPSRNDLPDADLDFMACRREEVIEYMRTRFGADKVAGISNYTELGAPSAIRDVARVYGHNVMDLTVSKLVPKVHGQPVSLITAQEQVGAIKEWSDENPDEWKNAVALEGVIRSKSKHAAGIIVSDNPIVENAALDMREEPPTVNWNMAVVEDAGLVKLDILGLSTLDTLNKCLEKIKESHGIDLDITAIPLDDPKTLDIFSKGRTQGIFQFEGGSVRKILRGMSKSNPLTFDDIVAANALNRPGPIEAGIVDDYIKCKNGDKVNYLEHPNMEAALKDTYNVICYQEQIMRISTDLCGFTLSEADKLRKIMGKKLPAEMAKMRDSFVNGAKTHSGMDEDKADDLFDKIELFAGYAFNKSHSASYSLISYIMAYIKAHYPIQFYAASLSTVPEKKLLNIIQDAKAEGITVLPPDINLSEADFLINEKKATLHIPFNRIKGISDKTTDAIVAERKANGPFKDVKDFEARVRGRNCNVRHIASLDKVGAFASVDKTLLPATDENRRKDQYELLPNLVVDYVQSDVTMSLARSDVKAINEMLKDLDTATGIKNVRPFIGSQRRVMVIQESASTKEEEKGKIGHGLNYTEWMESMESLGWETKDFYMTALLKKKKSSGMIAQADLSLYVPVMQQEIQIMQPPLIIALGSNVARALLPDLKGSMLDYAGQVYYDKKLDANILVGFNLASIYFDPDKREILEDIASKAAFIMRT